MRFPGSLLRDLQCVGIRLSQVELNFSARFFSTVIAYDWNS